LSYYIAKERRTTKTGVEPLLRVVGRQGNKSDKRKPSIGIGGESF